MKYFFPFSPPKNLPPFIILALTKIFTKKLQMFHPLSRLLLFWRAFLSFLIILENFNITICLFFDKSWGIENPIIVAIGTALKFLLIIDILVVCNTGIFISGSVKYNRKEAVLIYMKKKFIFDLISLMALLLPYFNENSVENPMNPAMLSSSKNIVKLLFLLKLEQVSTVYNYLEEILYTDETYEGVLSLMKLFIQVLMISHFIACAWHYSSITEKRLGNAAWLDKVSEFGGEIFDWSRIYLYAWYWSLATMITVGYGDFSPRNDKEVAVASVAMLFGCGFFAYAISSIGVIVERFSMKRKNFK